MKRENPTIEICPRHHAPEGRKRQNHVSDDRHPAAGSRMRAHSHLQEQIVHILEALTAPKFPRSN
jgi:hypothetical protein